MLKLFKGLGRRQFFCEVVLLTIACMGLSIWVGLASRGGGLLASLGRFGFSLFS